MTSQLVFCRHYNLGAAYEYHCKHDSAIEAFQNAVNIVESRIVNLNKVIEEGASEKGKGDDDVIMYHMTSHTFQKSLLQTIP